MENKEKLEILNFLNWLRKEGYILATESNDSESDQNLYESFISDEDLVVDYLGGKSGK